MKRVILLIIDGLGIGYMDDLAEQNRPEDYGANTLLHLLEKNPELELSNLFRLGLGNLLAGFGSGVVRDKQTPIAAYGRSRLKYQGADTYLGHQEIMGSLPRYFKEVPFKDVYRKVSEALQDKGFRVRIPESQTPYLIVDDLVVVADNIEADYGQIYNVTAPLDHIDFDRAIEIGKVVRNVVEVSRVIVLGGFEVTLADILASIESPVRGITGVNCKELGIYGEGYRVIHLGYGINPELQITSILADRGYDVRLIGKVQDVIQCAGARERIPMVDTNQVLGLLVEKMDEVEEGLIAVNVQETDLAGHAEDPQTFSKVLQIVDQYIPLLVKNIRKEDLLIITADHGNDPFIGHNHHTREYTPIMMYREGIRPEFIGVRETLADIATTIADYFGTDYPEDGTSFLR